MSKTMIMAIGGVGCNMSETIMREASVHWVREATYIFADTDQARLSDLGKKRYQTIDLKDSDIPRDIMKGVEKLYILAGLGGNAGGAYIADLANFAKNVGIHNVSAIVTTPFYFEGEKKITKAKEAIEALNGVKTKILHNDDLLEKYADINFATAFNYADLSVLKAIESSEI
ncbi:MAG: hypothetical protein K2L45_04805 [Muribaculaceae bacterium]|nr:hypothetical protein [Muribaculaceae bacterium]